MCKNTKNRIQFLLDINQLEKQFSLRERELKYPTTLKAFKVFKKMAHEQNFEGRWGKKQNDDFYSRMGDELSSLEREFRANIALAYIFTSLTKNKTKENEFFRVSSWPKVNLFPRLNLALNKSDFVYSDLELFEAMLQKLCSFRPTNRIESEKLCLFLVLRMIAVDGILIGGADKNISQMTTESIHENDGIAWVALPVGNQDKKSMKQYPVTQATMDGLKILKRRSGRGKEADKYLFPASIRLSKDKKKTKRRLGLEALLYGLCGSVNSAHKKYGKLGIKWWIQMSRQHMEIGGVPYIGIANMGNKLRIAQVTFENKPIKKKTGFGVKKVAGNDELELLRKVQSNIKPFTNSKKRIVDVKESLGSMLKGTIESYKRDRHISKKWAQLFDWFLYLVDDEQFSKLKVSTLLTFTYTITNRVFEHVDAESMMNLSKSDWLSLAKKVANDERYQASTKTTTLTHLRRFYYFLYDSYTDVPEINWEKECIKVHREIAEGFFITPRLFKEIIQLTKHGTAEWFALFMAYHIGLRCEEIFYLGIHDFEDWERVPVLTSKTKAGYRVVPLSSFLTQDQENDLRKLLKLKHVKESRILEFFDTLKTPRDLSTRIARHIRKLGFYGVSLHAFRHSFASMQLLRYFTLVEPDLKEYLVKTIPAIPVDALEGNQLKELAYVFGGSRWANNFDKYGRAYATPTDLCILSKLMGHTSRQTTLENYCNSFFWLQRFWILRRQERFDL